MSSNEQSNQPISIDMRPGSNDPIEVAPGVRVFVDENSDTIFLLRDQTGNSPTPLPFPDYSGYCFPSMQEAHAAVVGMRMFYQSVRPAASIGDGEGAWHWRAGKRAAATIRAEISTLEAELHTLSGEGLTVWDGMNGDLADIPPGGALMCVRWAIEDRSYDVWYPTVEAAKAALLALARERGCVPDQDGFHVDLTSPGCHTSKAWVQRNS